MPERTIDDETRYRLLRALAANPELSQRDLAQHFGISVGKVNYCLKALLEKGYVKAVNFKNSKHKSAYLYQLTPAGIAAKSHATVLFLQRKQEEYELLKREIELLMEEARQ